MVAREYLMRKGDNSVSKKNNFVIVWEDTDGDWNLSLASAGEVSDLYDMADCNSMENVKDILAVDPDSLKLVPVRIGSQTPINTDQENPFRYASSPLLAGNKQVGTITWTDH
jgi:hypothetical protein